MVTLGVDAHKRSHMVVAVDSNGRRVAEIRVEASCAGHLKAVRWARELSENRTWAVEDCRHLTRVLVGDLLRAGERVVNVPPKLMAGARRGARERGKSDPIDALAVARAALREPDLPVASLDGEERELRLLVDHRDDVVSERTRIQNRLRWHLHELFPQWQVPAGALDRKRWLGRIEERLSGVEGVVAEIAAELVSRCRALTDQANKLERRIAKRTEVLTPSLLAIRGCGALTAAKIVGETANVGRFKSEGAFAMHNGTAPIPVWSGAERMRLNRGGNRQLNCAIHRIVVTQWRYPGPARDYIERRMATGNTKREAIRLLRRHMSKIVHRALIKDQLLRTDSRCSAAA